MSDTAPSPLPPFVWLSQGEYGGGGLDIDEYDGGDEGSNVDIGFSWNIFAWGQSWLHWRRYLSSVEDSIEP